LNRTKRFTRGAWFGVLRFLGLKKTPPVFFINPKTLIILGMSYLEQGLYWYFKRVISGGLTKLFSRDYVVYSLLALLGVLTLVVVQQNFIVNVLSFGLMISLFVTSAYAFFIKKFAKPFFLSVFAAAVFFSCVNHSLIVLLLIPLRLACFYALIFLISLSSFLVVRDFISSWTGFVLFVGNPRGRTVFEPVINFLAIISLFYFPFSHQSVVIKVVVVIVTLVVLFVVNFVSRTGVNNIYSTIIGLFYLYFLYHAYMINNASSTVFLVDSLLVLFNVLFIAKGLSVNLGKRVKDEGTVILLVLGLVVGYAGFLLTLGSRSVGFYHSFSVIGFALVLLSSLFLFYSSARARHYLVYQERVSSIFKKAMQLGVRYLMRRME